PARKEFHLPASREAAGVIPGEGIPRALSTIPTAAWLSAWGTIGVALGRAPTPHSEPAALIQVVDYYKIYRDLVAVSGLSFEVKSGSILGLVGPNGAGKTTTLRALAGIIPPSRGQI